MMERLMYFHMRRSAWQVGEFLFFALFCTAILMLGVCGTAAADYCAAGDVRVAVYWDAPHGMEAKSLEVHCVDQETNIYLSEELTGPSGNTAGAQAIGSLALGWQSAYGSGITPSIEAGIAAGDADGNLKDLIIFTVPAGSYDEDVVVALRGWVSGNFTITGDGNPSGRATYSACFGPGNCVVREWHDEDGWAFSENFLLSSQLVAAGTTLSEPLIISRPVNSAVSVNGQSSSRDVSSGYTEISAALHLVAVNLPDGITWYSESGLFLLEQLCPGDFEGNGDVLKADLSLFALCFGRSDCDQGDACGGDLNGDNDVDGADLAIFSADFGRTDCPHF
jgi:hypothetical protein